MSDVLSSIWSYFETHPGRDILVYYILMVMIDQLPAPIPGGNAFYKWFFGVAQFFAAAWIRGKKGVQGQLGQPDDGTKQEIKTPNPMDIPPTPPTSSTSSTGKK